MIKRYSCLGILVVAAVGWMLFMSYVNTRTTMIDVTISGEIDEVMIFRRTDLGNPVVRIVTGGKDTTRTVELNSAQSFSPFIQSPPAQYSFMGRTGSRTFQGSLICCESGLAPNRRILTISGFQQWEIIESDQR